MARLIAAALALSAACFAQSQDQQFRQAGVCARCHVISVVEWGMSKHRAARTVCVACHGASAGHVADERNNVKPERVPKGEAVAGLCAGCHKNGCPKSGQKAGCQTCHHVHALVDPRKPAAADDQRLEESAAGQRRYSGRMEEGERAAAAENWQAARSAFQEALKLEPGDARAPARLRMCERRINPRLPGFEISGPRFDRETGLPREVRVAGPGIPMLLVAGGEFEMGSDRFPGAGPVHTVRVEPFYLGKYELTQAEWTALMGANPSARTGDNLPVERVSWQDCQEFLQRLNGKTQGGAFRLPTEAEWEFAARAGSAEAAEPGSPRPVTELSPDKLGFYGLLGNVWEWTSSLYKPYPYGEAGEQSGLRVLRGGGFADSREWFDAAARHPERPGRRLRWNGMRLARSIPEP